MSKPLDIFPKPTDTTSPTNTNSSTKSQSAVETLLYDDWVKTILACMPIGIIGFFSAIFLEKLSHQETPFDALIHPIGAGSLVVIGFFLLLKPQNLRFVISSVCLGLSAFLISKLTLILFFLPEGMDPRYQMTESFFWISTIYLIAFLIPDMRIGQVIAVSFTGIVVIVSLIYTGLSFVQNTVMWGVMYPLIQLNLSSVMALGLTSAFMRLRESFDKTRDQEVLANQLARYDRLTGLPNRLMLQEELEHYIDSPATHNLALLFIDIDGFKSINDALGHQFGDELLQHIAGRFNSTIQDCNAVKEQESNPNRDLVSRISGDEFVFVIRDVKTPTHAENVANTLIESFKQPFSLSGEHVTITSSIGICFYPQDGTNCTSLLNRADIAMYQAKQSGKNKFCVYTEEMTLAAKQERELSNDLRLALNRNEFELYYQPIINLQSNKIDKFEALIRWHHPEKGLVPPDMFIPIAEKVGLIVPIDRWVLEKASKTAKVWQSFLPDVSVAVNMSPVQFSMPDLCDYVLDTLKTTDLAPELLELEVTESVVIENLNDSSQCLNVLRSHGIKIAIDDFGTGYSSLAYLQNLPADTVKIDKSFIDNLTDDNENAEFTEKLISVIVDLSKHLNRKIVAEGIETTEQLTWLQSADCHLGQGYYFSKPIPYDDMLLKYGSHHVIGSQVDSTNFKNIIE